VKILLYGLNYAPEPTGIGKYTGEMAAFLAARGHQVRAVTAPPYYPHWRVTAGYSAWAYRREECQGVRVYRCPLWVPAHPSGLTRLLHLSSFALSSLPVILGQAFWRPDLLLCIAPAIASAPAGWLAARLGGSRAWLHIQDFELDAALRLGMLPALLRPLERLLLAAERILLKRFERISTISQRMLEHLWQKGIPPERTASLPNWVDTSLITPLPGPSPLRSAWGIPENQTVVLYSGNFGHKQGLETLVQAARLLQDEPGILFLLCGEGAARPLIEQHAQGLSNLRIQPLQPAEHLNDLLNLADIHALPQRGDTADLVMPSKLGGMLASGRPVIAAAAPGSELAGVVGPLGVIVPPEDPAALAEAIRSLRQQPDVRLALGQRGRQFVLEHWDNQIVLSKFCQEIEAL